MFIFRISDQFGSTNSNKRLHDILQITAIFFSGKNVFRNGSIHLQLVACSSLNYVRKTQICLDQLLRCHRILMSSSVGGIATQNYSQFHVEIHPLTFSDVVNIHKYVVIFTSRPPQTLDHRSHHPLHMKLCGPHNRLGSRNKENIFIPAEY